MARALARGWGEPVLCSDSGSGRAAALAAELGGEAVTNPELAERAELVVLCHKPGQLAQVAGEIGGRARAVVSILARVDLAALGEHYPGLPVARAMPNLPVEVRRGATVYAVGADGALRERVAELFGRLGLALELPEGQMGVAGGVSGVGPAYVALVAEAQVDAAVRRGLPAATAAELVRETIAGTAELLRVRGGDTLALRREVASPGGTTARGLAALERAGLRAAFAAALDDVLAPAP